MTIPVPAGYTPGSAKAIEAGCVCHYPENNAGAGWAEAVEHDSGDRHLRFSRQTWMIDVACRVHGGGKFVPFTVPKAKSKK